MSVTDRSRGLDIVARRSWAVFVCMVSLAGAGAAAINPGHATDEHGPPLGAGVEWVETFDDYEDGQELHGVNGWKGFFNDPANSARVTSVMSRSAPHSVDVSNQADIVHEFDGLHEGWWRMTAWQFVPSEKRDKSFYIVYSQYTDHGVLEGGLAIEMDGGDRRVRNYIDGPEMPLIVDRWVELVTIVFFDSTSMWGRHSFFYDGVPLYLGKEWGCPHATCDPPTHPTALDLFADDGSPVYYDDLELFVGGCARNPGWLCDGDVDGDGQVNPVDAGLVQSAFGSTDEQDLCNYDLDCDGRINPVDSGIVQGLFGTCAPPRDVCP